MRRILYIAPYLGTEDLEDGTKIRYYGKPKMYRFSLNSLSGDTELQIFGDKVSRMVRAIADFKYMEEIHENDAAFLYGEVPDDPDVLNLTDEKGYLLESEDGSQITYEESNYCLNANYRVSKVLPQNLKIAIYFEKNVEENES